MLQKGHFHKSEQRSEPKALSFTVGEYWWRNEAHSFGFFPDKSMLTLAWIQVNDTEMNDEHDHPLLTPAASFYPCIEAFGS